jgi:hypothetical protein
MGQFDSAGRQDGLTRRPAEWLKIENFNLKIFIFSKNSSFN